MKAKLSQREKNLRRVPISKQVVPLVLQRLSNAEILVAMPDYNPRSVAEIAGKVRRMHNITARNDPRYPPLHLPPKLWKALRAEKMRRAKAYDSAEQLALHLLAIIIRDDMFDAVLDWGSGETPVPAIEDVLPGKAGAAHA